MKDKLTAHQPGDVGDVGGVLDLQFHWNHPERILFQGPGFTLWTSNDFGKTYESHDTPGHTLGLWMDVKIHPEQPEWLLSRVRRNECLRYDADVNPWCAHDLFVSKDFAKSWTNLTANSKGAVGAFWDFDWGANMLHWNTTAGFTDETILATAYENKDAMKGPYPGWDKDIHFIISHNLFTSQHEKVVPCGNQFEILAHRIYLAMPASCPVEPDGSKASVPESADERNAVKLYTSEDEGNTFVQACLPVKLLDKGYNLIRTHDHSGAFAIVDHDEEDEFSANAPIGNVYAPGYSTSLFTLSMTRNFRRSFITDFARVEGLPGVYLANQLSKEVFEDPSMIRRQGKVYEDFVQTKIATNGGGQWSHLQVPDKYNSEVCNRCKGMPDPAKCKLHLHGPSGWIDGPGARPSFYSHWNAPGMVMAAGNTGEYLDLASDAVCTWMSTDGGLTWTDVADHAAIYEFGDHGGIIVLAPHEASKAADHVKVSMDGSCWHTIQLPAALNIQNIRVEPDGKSKVFVVHGEECIKTAASSTCTLDPGYALPKGIMYVLDMQDIMAEDFKVCNEQSDYEAFSPPRADLCLLGQNLTYENHRKRSVACFNNNTYSRHDVQEEPCPCEHADLECEYGFEREGNSSCLPLVEMPPETCPQIAKGDYYVSDSHMRLVHSDQCKGVARVLSDTDGHGNCIGDHCPGGKHSRRRGGWLKTFLILLLVIILVGGGIIAWQLFAPEGLKASAEELLAPVIACCSGIVGWVQDRVARLTGRHRREAEGAYFEPLAGGEGLMLDEEDARSPPLFQMR
jgi:hypothetical protein